MPSVNADYKRLQKGKNEKHLEHKKKQKWIKNESFLIHFYKQP